MSSLSLQSELALYAGTQEGLQASLVDLFQDGHSRTGDSLHITPQATARDVTSTEPLHISTTTSGLVEIAEVVKRDRSSARFIRRTLLHGLAAAQYIQGALHIPYLHGDELMAIGPLTSTQAAQILVYVLDTSGLEPGHLLSTINTMSGIESISAEADQYQAYKEITAVARCQVLKMLGRERLAETR